MELAPVVSERVSNQLAFFFFKNKPSFTPRQIKKPSLSSARTGPLYYQAPPQLEAATRPNLEKTCGELFQEEDEVTVTDAGLPFQLTLRILFET